MGKLTVPSPQLQLWLMTVDCFSFVLTLVDEYDKIQLFHILTATLIFLSSPNLSDFGITIMVFIYFSVVLHYQINVLYETNNKSQIVQKKKINIIHFHKHINNFNFYE